jgi:hypothetical protein
MPAKQPDNTIVQPILDVINAFERRPPAKPSARRGDAYVAEITAAKEEMRRRAATYPEPPGKPAA